MESWHEIRARLEQEELELIAREEALEQRQHAKELEEAEQAEQLKRRRNNDEQHMNEVEARIARMLDELQQERAELIRFQDTSDDPVPDRAGPTGPTERREKDQEDQEREERERQIDEDREREDREREDREREDREYQEWQRNHDEQSW